MLNNCIYKLFHDLDWYNRIDSNIHRPIEFLFGSELERY
jgi:hypothetical protein